MNNKQLLDLLDVAEAQRELAEAIKSGSAVKELRALLDELRKERAALEKAHGGAKTLADADARAAAIAADADRRASETLSAANKAIAEHTAKLDERERVLDGRNAAVETAEATARAQAEALAAREAEIAKAEKKIEADRKDIAARSAALDARDAALAKAENEFAQRKQRLESALT